MKGQYGYTHMSLSLIITVLVVMAGTIGFLLSWNLKPAADQLPELIVKPEYTSANYNSDYWFLADSSVPDAQTLKQMGVRVRTLDVFYSRRAYIGAPPFIPHPVDNDRPMGGDCLSCHAKGGFTRDLQAFAPVTPHPEFSNCRQCHVPRVESGEFRPTGFAQNERPRLKQRAMPGSPFIIPHSLQMRENCLACHAGPGAVAEIRVSHPERINCRQCHVPAETQQPFQPAYVYQGDSQP